MWRRFGGTIGVLLVLMLARPAAADDYDILDAPFDARPMQVVEKRLVQAALAAAGYYWGLLDGRWGNFSQAAVEAYAAAEFGAEARNIHVAFLALEFIDEIEAGGWELRGFHDLGLAFAFPRRLMQDPEPEDGFTRWWSVSGDLGILTGRLAEAEARDWHATVARLNVRPDALDTYRGPDRLVTGGELADGRIVYSRSDRIGGRWSTVHLAAEPDAANRLNLIASSIGPGAPDDWTLPEAGWLSAMLALTAEVFAGILHAPAEAGTPPEAAVRLPEPNPGAPGWLGTGTGFFINATDLVTAWHVVESCEAITRADGGGMNLIASDPARDLAVLVSAERSAAWLPIGNPDGIRLGQEVRALGYPYYSLTGTGLNLTTGNVSALAGLDDDRRFVALSAPIQPGNSGGPVLARDGAVLGVVVARLSERFIADATGSLPQNVNYAVTADELAAFLAAHHRGFESGPGHGPPPEDGVSEPAQRAVVPIICW